MTKPGIDDQRVGTPSNRKPDPVPSETEWLRPHILTALAAHDFAAIYRHLQKIGYSQNRIGRLVKQAQPEISAVLGGRVIYQYDLMARAANGLGIPRCLLGLSFGDCITNSCPHHPPAHSNYLNYTALLTAKEALLKPRT